MKISIIGLGLIGGSLAKALIKNGTYQVGGYDQDSHTRELAEKAGIEIFPSVMSLARESDMIVICTPISAFESVLSSVASTMKKGAIITDACSAKEVVWNSAQKVLTKEQLVNYIPGHPISGKETSGFEVSESSLFLDKRVVLTPVFTETFNSSMIAFNEVEHIWINSGAIVEMMDMKEHDDMFALTSHLPHILTYATMEMMHIHCDDIADALHHTGGGFKDFIRIAKSDPTMWSDIAIGNKKPLLKWMKLYKETLEEMIELVELDAKLCLFDIIERSKNNLT